VNSSGAKPNAKPLRTHIDALVIKYMTDSLITIVFTDLVNSTDIKTKMPGDDITARNELFLKQILQPHCKLVETTIGEYGGAVAGNTGDGYFLTFQETHRAVLWAIKILKCHREKPIQTPLGDLEVRIGIHLGKPLPNGMSFMGHEVDYTARVTDCANGGQIVLSALAGHLVEASGIKDSQKKSMTTYNHGPFDLKGIGAVNLHELIYEGRQPGVLRKSGLKPPDIETLPLVRRKTFIKRLAASVTLGVVLACSVMAYSYNAEQDVRSFDEAVTYQKRFRTLAASLHRYVKEHPGSVGMALSDAKSARKHLAPYFKNVGKAGEIEVDLPENFVANEFLEWEDVKKRSPGATIAFYDGTQSSRLKRRVVYLDGTLDLVDEREWMRFAAERLYPSILKTGGASKGVRTNGPAERLL
jgi:class 3 adenylate cyclase